MREPAHPAEPAAATSRPAGWSRRPTRAQASHASRRVAEVRLARRLTEATDLLAPAGIRIAALDPGQATAVLAAACNPDTLIPIATTRLAASDDIITTYDQAGEQPSPSPHADTEPGEAWWNRLGNDHPGEDP